MGHELPACWPRWEPPLLRTRGRWRGQPGRVWASHPVTAATLALEVALGVLLMAHMGKLRHRMLRAPPRVSQCTGAPTPRPHHFRPAMAGQAWCVFACLLPPGHFGRQPAHGECKSVHLTATARKEEITYSCPFRLRTGTRTGGFRDASETTPAPVYPEGSAVGVSHAHGHTLIATIHCVPAHPGKFGHRRSTWYVQPFLHPACGPLG